MSAAGNGCMMKVAIQPADAWVTGLAETTWSSLEESVRDRTLVAIYDALGVSTAGFVAPGIKGMIEGLQRSTGIGNVPVPWTPVTLGAAPAAMALAGLIHAWDYDDTHDAAVIHSTCLAVPAALAAAATCQASGPDVLAAVVVGIQVAVRLSLAIGPQFGMIRTAGIGAFAAAAAAARALQLDPQRFAAALALALPCGVSPTSRQVVVDGAISKRVQPGQSVMSGMTAAFLASEGIEGPAKWLTGEYGLLRLAVDQDAAMAQLTAPGWEVPSLALKPYPACRYTHAAIAAALEAGRNGWVAGDVEVHVPIGTAYEFVSRPFERRGHPVVDVQFSIPWLVAAALRDGVVDLETIDDDHVEDREIDFLAGRVRVVQDLPPQPGMGPAEVVLSDGSGERRVRRETAPGSEGVWLSWDEVSAKIGSCLAVGGGDRSDVERIHHLVKNFEKILPGEVGDTMEKMRL